MKKRGLLIWFLGAAVCMAGEPRSFSLPLRESDPVGLTEEIITKGGGVAMVSRPEIAVHLPDPAKANGLAMIVCPGGSYREVGLFANGMRTVPYFVPKGTAVIVLKYRTRPPSKNVEAEALEDAKRAVRLVREHAAEWNIDPHRIGMVGSSAGSHLILNLATHWDRGNPGASDLVERQSCRPDFMVLLCPWPNKQPLAAFPVNSETPPAFIASARDDTVAPYAFAEGLAAALSKEGVPVKLWSIPNGGHRAFKQVKNTAYRWPARVIIWLRESGFWEE